MIIKNHRNYSSRIWIIIAKKLQNAPIVSLQPVSIMERRMKIHRFMMRTLISKNIRISELFRILTSGDITKFISEISSQ